MMTKAEEHKYDFIVEHGIATPEELNLAFNLVDGNWTEVLARVLYIREGYRTLDQLAEAWGLDEEDY